MSEICREFGMRRRRRFILFSVVISVWSYTVASAIQSSFIGGGGRSLGRTYNICHSINNPSKLIASTPSTRLHANAVESSTTNNVTHSFASTTNNPSASTTTNKEFGSDHYIIHPIMRCSSFDAAEIIRNCTADGESLLIITCDASGRGGGSKHDGIASILRVRNGISYLANETTSALQSNENVDLIDVIAKRTIPSRTSSEVAAISLGIRRAMSIMPKAMRKNVLILSDSEFSLDFYCKGSEHISFNNDNDNSIPKRRRAINNKQKKKKKGRKQITTSMERRDESYRRSLVALIKDTPNRIFISKIRSSSRGAMLSTNTNGDNEDMSWNGIGFIDHDAADHLSSIARSIPNSRDDEEKKMIDMSNAVKPLGESDLRWLANSESDILDNKEGSADGFWRTMNSMGSEARSDRRDRSKRRTYEIEQMLGMIL